MSIPQRVPDVANLGDAARIGAAHIKGALDTMRKDAQREDDFNVEREPQIRGGGQSREYYVLGAGEWGQAYGYLRAVADMEAEKKKARR